MLAALVTSVSLRIGFGLRESDPLQFAWIVLITAGLTTAVWLTVTLLTKPEPRDVLLAFYRRVQPSPALWGPVAREAEDVIPSRDGLFNLLDWVLGVLMIYAFLFGAGSLIFGRPVRGCLFLAAGLIFGALIYIDLNRRGWKTIGG